VVSYEKFICCNSFKTIQLQELCLQGYNKLCIFISRTRNYRSFCKGSVIPLKHYVRNCFVTIWVPFLFISLVKSCRRFATHVIMSNSIHTQILGKFVFLLLCSKGVKISVIYWHISDWNKEKIGISKCKNMHIGATLPSR